MKHFMVAATSLAVALSFTASAWAADEKLSDAEAKSATATATMWGCEGGTWQKEANDHGYEADDVKCKDGAKYDMKLDKDFKLTSITRG
jgi:hypothetical protein